MNDPEKPFVTFNALEGEFGSERNIYIHQWLAWKSVCGEDVGDTYALFEEKELDEALQSEGLNEIGKLISGKDLITDGMLSVHMPTNAEIMRMQRAGEYLVVSDMPVDVLPLADEPVEGSEFEYRQNDDCERRVHSASYEELGEAERERGNCEDHEEIEPKPEIEDPDFWNDDGPVS